MQTLIVIAIAGLAAQLVDGSLGMGYGLTSSTLLILLIPSTTSYLYKILPVSSIEESTDSL